MVTERLTHRSDLPKNIPVYIRRLDFVVDYSRGKDVLHLGCVDAGLIEQKQAKELWLHDRINTVANSLWGVDIDVAGIERMRAQGYTNLYHANIENLASVPGILEQSFNLILLTEVLEHLNNPGLFLENLKPLFKPETEMLITVPNSTSLSNLIENLHGRELVHPDHNYWYSIHTLQSLLDKYGYQGTCVGVYSQYDYRRSISEHLWKRILYHAGFRSRKSAQEPSARVLDSNRGKLKPLGWLNATFTTVLYRLLLNRRPFFADGLIVLVTHQAADRDVNNAE